MVINVIFISIKLVIRLGKFYELVQVGSNN